MSVAPDSHKTCEIKKDTRCRGERGRHFDLTRGAMPASALIGVATIVGSTVASAVSSVAIKLSVDKLSPEATVFFSSVISVILVAPLVAISEDKGIWRIPELSLDLLRGVLIGATTLLFSWAVVFSDLATVAAINASGPVFAFVLASLAVDRAWSTLRLGCLLIGFAGMLAIVEPSAGHLSIGHGLALASALAAAVAFALTKPAACRDPWAVTYLKCNVAMAGLLAYPALQDGWLGPQHIGALLLLAVSSVANQWLLLSALTRVPAQLATPFQYLKIVWTAAFAYLLFDEVPRLGLLLGCSLIVGAIIVFLHLDEGRKL